MLDKMEIMPKKIWYVTKVRRKRIDKVGLFLSNAKIRKIKKYQNY